MLHKLELAGGIIAALTQAVHVQFALLAYAAGHRRLNRAECEDFVNAVPELAGRGGAVAAWLWSARSRSRLPPLTAFANAGRRADREVWATLLQQEAMDLLAGPPAHLTPLTAGAPRWQRAGAKFLRQFYHDFSGSALPGEMLGLPGQKFGRDEYLGEFTAANPGLYVCAACDEARVGTRSRGRLIADIDHYFPKSLYPHLSIHPFNLVPVCHACNSSIKGDIDPLAATPRRSPADPVLPYGLGHLAETTFLRVDLDEWRGSGAPFSLRALDARATAAHIDCHGSVARIPERWNDRVVVDEIGETAFRRLSQFLRAQPGVLDDSAGILDKVDEFLGMLQVENLGRDPLTFPVKWLLAHLADEAQHEGANALLAKELRNWTQRPRTDAERRRAGAALRQVVSSGP